MNTANYIQSIPVLSHPPSFGRFDVKFDWTVSATSLPPKYYNFGMPMPGRNMNSGDYRYGYNGMEQDPEIKGTGNSYDFGERIQDPRLGRFLSLDPVERLFVGESKYSFAGNNPILFIDMGGAFKFPAGNNYATQYPKLTNYIQNTIQKAANDPKVLAALAKYSEMSVADVKKALTWGQGPTINVTALKGAYGEFTPNSGSTELRLDVGLVKKLEAATGTKELDFQFLVEVTTLHEFTHYGDDQDGKDIPGEEGEHFENAAYGTVVTESNMATVRKATNNTTTMKSSSSGTGAFHTIQKGETLYSIAKKNGTTIGAIQKLNSSITDVNKIQAGDKIQIK